ncbi:MAG: DUF5666 domain-containing protein, partial [Candidatus Dormibacteria bacterium]
VVACAAAGALTHGSRGGAHSARLIPARPAQFHAGGGRMGHPGMGFFGASGGTITQISGSTLTLRTQQGTETVDTSNSTTYTKDRQTIAFSDLKVGDIVHVVPAAGAAKPATPGTGTISASRVVVVDPMLLGRVASVDGDTVNLVGRDGRELTVTLTGATKYYNGQASADRSAVTVGSRIVAMGTQDTLTHLTASTVTVLPAGSRAAGPMWRGGMPGRAGRFGAGAGAGGGGRGFAPGGFGA